MKLTMTPSLLHLLWFGVWARRFHPVMGCSFAGGNPGSILPNDPQTAFCFFLDPCVDTTVSGCSKVVCSGAYACTRVTVIGAEVVECSLGDAFAPSCVHSNDVPSIKFETQCLRCLGEYDCGEAGAQVNLNGTFIPGGSAGEFGNCPDLTDGTGKSRKFFCFSAFNTVEVRGRGTVSIDSLRVGDMVKSHQNNNKESFSRVWSFMHKDPDAVTEFIQIQTENSKQPLELSPEHFVFVGNKGKVVSAKDVQEGDVLGGNRVISIQRLTRQGIYAPVTESGEIVVSGVSASCYVDLLPGIAANIQVYMSHGVLAYYRLISKLGSSFDDNLTLDGFAVTMCSLIHTGFHVATYNVALQLVVLMVCMPAVTALSTMEMLLLTRCTGLLLVAAALVGVSCFKKKFSSTTTKKPFI
jgi:hypothetical protein